MAGAKIQRRQDKQLKVSRHPEMHVHSNYIGSSNDDKNDYMHSPLVKTIDVKNTRALQNTIKTSTLD